MSREEIKRELVKGDNLFTKHFGVFRILDDTRMNEEESEERNERGGKILSGAAETGLSRIDEGKLKALLEHLDVVDIERIVDDLKKFLEGRIKEKISGSKERYEGKLESTLSPLIKLNYGEDPVRILVEIYYRLIKNHPFIDGNKKIATAFLLSALTKQNVELSDEDMGDITVHVARSDATEHTNVVDRIMNYIKYTSKK